MNVNVQKVSVMLSEPDGLNLTSVVSEAIFSDLAAHAWTDAITVLEAGGGSASHVRFLAPSVQYHTIDISPQQLERNTYATETILGDLQEHDFPPETYDAVVCYDVLEHLPSPEAAVERMMAATAIGGILILKSPLAKSFKGLVTKFTPHWFHVLIYRHIFGNKDAGKPGFPPFKTWLRWHADPDTLEKMLNCNGFEILSKRFFILQEHRLRERSKVIYAFYKAIGRMVEAITFGKIQSSVTDYYLIARKQHAAS